MDPTFIQGLSKVAFAEAIKIFFREVFEKRKNAHVGDDDIQGALYNHMRSTFEKCTKIKTILRDEQEEFSKIYSSQPFHLNQARINQDELVQFIRNGESVILQGTGGGGKSMFVRYLWIKIFSEFKDKIPIFFELRNVNSSQETSMIDHLYYYLVGSSTKKLSRETFEAMLAEGRFLLFLDGFDEVAIKSMEKFQSEILALRDRFPDLTMLITSRPHERFGAWYRFNSVHIAKLNLEECISVIQKSPYREESKKRRLLKKIRNNLFETHESFLTNPLLIYMTIVTYNYNPDFSDQMIEFYNLTFEALYYRHDQTKEGGYKREYATGYDKVKFEKILSLLCLITYFENKVEFTKAELDAFIDRAKGLESDVFQDLKNDDLLRDMMQNVCIIKQEGQDLSFTHRKLQEYFAAYCLSRVSNKNMGKILNRISDRHFDEVIRMSYHLNKEGFREKYILEKRKQYQNFFSLRRKSAIASKFTEISNMRFHVRPIIRVNENGKTDDDFDEVIIHLEGSGDLWNFQQALDSIFDNDYSKSEDEVAAIREQLKIDNEFGLMLMKEVRSAGFEQLKVAYVTNSFEVYVANGDEFVRFPVAASAAIWKNTRMREFVEEIACRCLKIVHEECEKLSNNEDRLEDIINS